MNYTSSDHQCHCHLKINDDLSQIIQSSNELKKSKAVCSGIQLLVDKIQHMESHIDKLQMELNIKEQNLNKANSINKNLSNDLEIYRNSLSQNEKDKKSLAEYVTFNENKIRNYDNLVEQINRLKNDYETLQEKFNSQGKNTSKCIEELTNKHNYQLNEILQSKEELIIRVNELDYNNSIKDFEIKKLQMVIRSLNCLQRRILIDVPKNQINSKGCKLENFSNNFNKENYDNIFVSDENKNVHKASITSNKTTINQPRSLEINNDIEDISREISIVESVILKLSEQLKLIEACSNDKDQVNFILERIENESIKLIDLKKRFNIRYRELVNF